MSAVCKMTWQEQRRGTGAKQCFCCSKCVQIQISHFLNVCTDVTKFMRIVLAAENRLQPKNVESKFGNSRKERQHFQWHGRVRREKGGNVYRSKLRQFFHKVFFRRVERKEMFYSSKIFFRTLFSPPHLLLSEIFVAKRLVFHLFHATLMCENKKETGFHIKFARLHSAAN